MIRLFIALLALLGPAAASAAPGQMELTSTVQVERLTTDATGKQRVTLEEPAKVVPGDRLLFTLTYANRGTTPATDFAVTNPVPSAVLFAGGESAGAQVSVDGGNNWGALAALKVAGADGKPRAAVAADVTHIRWTFAKPIPAGEGGTLSFRALVR